MTTTPYDHTIICLMLWLDDISNSEENSDIKQVVVYTELLVKNKRSNLHLWETPFNI